MKLLRNVTHLFLRSDFQEFYHKGQISIRRNDSTGPASSIPVIAGNFESGLLAQAHLSNTFIPPLNDLTDANGELKRTTAITGGVELFAIGRQCAAICS